MQAVRMATLDGGTATLDASQLDQFKGWLQGGLLTAESPDYDQARTVWNAMIDRRPALIARCRSAADVQHAVHFADLHNLLVSVRGAGHNIAGNAVCNGGLMIDLSQMNSVTVDAAGRTAHVEPGATLAQFDAEAQKHGLATPLGINSTTGIAGLTLGGGFGWLTRKYGFTVDNLIGADVVTADGALMRASADENPDLFWAIRGGGGNFGIVTAFDFKLHRVGPEVFAGLVVHPFAAAPDLLRKFRSFVATAPEALTTWLVFRKAPPLPFLPEAWHGREVAVVAFLFAGDVQEGERAIEPMRRFGNPVGEHVGAMPYSGFQQAFDPLLTPGMRNYWKSHDFKAITDPVIDNIVEYVSRLPTPHCEIFMGHLGGASARVPADAMAFCRRDAEFVMNVHTRWDNPSDDGRCIAWARDLFDAMTPHAMGSVYVNFMPEDEQARTPAAFGDNYTRLATIKATYDPKNRFRMNQNIQPAAV